MIFVYFKHFSYMFEGGGWPNHSKRPYVTIFCNIRFMVSPPPFPGLALRQKGPLCGQSLFVFIHLFMAHFWFTTTLGWVFVIIVLKNKHHLVIQTTGSCVFVALGKMRKCHASTAFHWFVFFSQKSAFQNTDLCQSLPLRACPCA